MLQRTRPILIGWAGGVQMRASEIVRYSSLRIHEDFCRKIELAQDLPGVGKKGDKVTGSASCRWIGLSGHVRRGLDHNFGKCWQKSDSGGGFIGVALALPVPSFLVQMDTELGTGRASGTPPDCYQWPKLWDLEMQCGAVEVWLAYGDIDRAQREARSLRQSKTSKIDQHWESFLLYVVGDIVADEFIGGVY